MGNEVERARIPSESTVAPDQTVAAEAGGTLAGTADHASPPSAASWQRQLAEAIRDRSALLAALDLADDLPRAEAEAAAAQFPVLVPRAFLGRMRRGDRHDPLLRQVLADAAEMAPQPAGFSADPLAEGACQPVPGLLRKYRGRALLTTTGACAVHCRYCFRRHFPYADLPRGRRWWQPALEALAADPDCHEVLLSGGDPLVLPDRQLDELLADFGGLPQVKRLRIHTRLPIVIPDRVTEGLCAALDRSPVPVVVVLHANHPAELDAAVGRAATRLRDAAHSLLNQAVLLVGVNDDATVQIALSEALFGIGVLPYYLHVLDPVVGAAHFRLPDARIHAIFDTMHAELPGYLLPRLVREEAGAVGKSLLGR